MIYLLMMSGRSLVDGTSQTFRFGTHGYAHPSAPAFFAPRLVQPALFRRDLFDRGRTGGASKTGWGEIILRNDDGGCDDLTKYAFDDGDLQILALNDINQPLTAAQVLLTGTMEQVLVGLTDVRIRVRDRQALLSKPVQAETYGGTNVLPDGVDGVDDIRGQVKPDGWGSVLNAEPVMVNSAKSIYHISSEPIQGINAVYDSGLALFSGSERTLGELLTLSPSSGYFDYCLSDVKGAFIRLSAPPAGRVTVDFSGITRLTGFPLSAPQIMRDILLHRSVLTADDLVDSDFDAAHAIRPWPCGLYMTEDSQIPDLLDALAASGGFWWGFDKVGKVRIKPILPPASPPVVTFRFLDGASSKQDEADLLSLDVSATTDQGRGIPVWRVRVGYGRCWSVQDAAEIVSAADRTADFSGQEYRWCEQSDSTVQDLHPSAGDLQVQTLLAAATDASALAGVLALLYCQTRQIIKVSALVSAELAEQIDLGVVVCIRLDRFGWASGKLFLVTGLRYDLEAGVLEADLWG